MARPNARTFEDITTQFSFLVYPAVGIKGFHLVLGHAPRLVYAFEFVHWAASTGRIEVVESVALRLAVPKREIRVNVLVGIWHANGIE